MKRYLDNGKAVWVTRELYPGYLVQDIYESDDFGEPYHSKYDKEYFVENVYDKAPTVKFETEIDELTLEIARLRETKKTMRLRIKEVEKEAETQFDKYKDRPGLELLDNFINGEITHYAVLGVYGPEIVKFEDATCENWTKELKLLTLFGGNKGDLEWKLNRYSNGEGSSKTVVPCLSLEQAKIEIKKFIDSEIDFNHTRKSFIDCAEKYGFEIGADYVSKYYQQIKERKRDSIKKHEEEIKQLKKDLRTIT